MTNAVNQSLIAEIINNRCQFLKFALKQCKRSEVSEDLIQRVVVRLLTKPIEVHVLDNKNFICTMIVQENLNYYKINKKYKFFNDMKNEEDSEENSMNIIMEHQMGCSFESDIYNSLRLKEIKKAAMELTPGQQKAILTALAGDKVGDELGMENVSSIPRYMSLKTNKRLATEKLKRKFA